MSISDSLIKPQYNASLFDAMCTLAFYAFLRIGEITKGKDSKNVLLLRQVTKLTDSSGNIVGLKITFESYKHHYNQPPVSITLLRQKTICPVELFLRYLTLRGSSPGWLFQHLDGSPITRLEFTNWLNTAVNGCGLDPSRYKSHSFRIGAASFAADQGLSETKIRLLGRWKSDAFKRYIRITSITLP